MAMGLISTTEINNNFLKLQTSIDLFSSRIKNTNFFKIKSMLNYHIHDDFDNRINELKERLDIHLNIINETNKTDKKLIKISMESFENIINYFENVDKSVDLNKVFDDFMGRDWIEINPKYINYFIINHRKMTK